MRVTARDKSAGCVEVPGRTLVSIPLIALWFISVVTIRPNNILISSLSATSRRVIGRMEVRCPVYGLVPFGMKQMELSSQQVGRELVRRHDLKICERKFMLCCPACDKSLAVMDDGPGALSRDEQRRACFISVGVGGVMRAAHAFCRHGNGE